VESGEESVVSNVLKARSDLPGGAGATLLCSHCSFHDWILDRISDIVKIIAMLVCRSNDERNASEAIKEVLIRNFGAGVKMNIVRSDYN
jgi:hypothetical protein